jgi:hypothetical protein
MEITVQRGAESALLATSVITIPIEPLRARNRRRARVSIPTKTLSGHACLLRDGPYLSPQTHTCCGSTDLPKGRGQ